MCSCAAEEAKEKERKRRDQELVCARDGKTIRTTLLGERCVGGGQNVREEDMVLRGLWWVQSWVGSSRVDRGRLGSLYQTDGTCLFEVFNSVAGLCNRQVATQQI